MYPQKCNEPEIVEAPCATYIMARGRGAWDDPHGKFAEASHILRNIHKELAEHSDGFDQSLRFTPLEAFWWQQGTMNLNLDDKESFIWAVAMQVGEVTNQSFSEACKRVAERKSLDCGNVFLSTILEGSCAQIRHSGGYEHEKETVATLAKFIEREGYGINRYGFSPLHEIYLPLKEKDKRGQWDTVYRRPISKKPPC